MAEDDGLYDTSLGVLIIVCGLRFGDFFARGILWIVITRINL